MANENTSTIEPKRNMQKRDSRFKKSTKKNENKDFDKRIVSIRRVTRSYKGGKRMRLSVMVVTGDKNGRVGIGMGKGADVKSAEDKAFSQAKKNMKLVTLKGTTIPHEITFKLKAAKVFLKPAAPGTGVIAGGAIRAVVEMAGIKDILTKVIGTSNGISNVYATLGALSNLKSIDSNHVK
jgi:small subunit ribosomal protein S5